ncbi:MAG: histidine kinase dimerization/phospho-acceptor domain-containing protein, partial [Thalassolituus sp.]
MTDGDLHSSLNSYLPERFPVLVVDDDQSVLDVTRLVLNRYRFDGRGVECLEATSAEEAYEVLEAREDVAVLLLDVVMEDDDAGLKLVERIRQNLNNQRLRIILRTGQAGFAPEYRVVQNYDINDYLAKSESTQERLYVSLTTALRGYRDILAANIYARRALEAEKEREVAARALDARTRFLAHLSHEVRNPLTGMLGIVELLEDSPEAEIRDGLIRDLGYTVHTLLGVVDDVLDVAKIEAGKLKLHHQVFNSRNWLERTIGVYAASMQQKGIRLTTEVDDLVPQRLIGDPSRLR